MVINIYNTKDQVFQVDSQIVRNAYSTLDNYLIINDQDAVNELSERTCVIYFSGHSIYFPNDELTFRKQIIEKNRFEWFGIRVKGASKHIFVRDIHKQWYLSGINNKINSPEKLLDFLRNETKGYKIICIGSSAGGYAALLYGSQLGAIKTYAFSPRIEMQSLEWNSTPQRAPLYYRLKDTSRRKYMDLIPFLKDAISPMYCFYPANSKLDSIQLEHFNQNEVKGIKKVHIIKFKTSKHGVPFPKVALNGLLDPNMIKEIDKYENRLVNPIWFSFKMVGIIQTIRGIYKQIKNHYRN